MLKVLRVENVAVLERVEVEFVPGFNALTGETGAGKSVLLQALAWALGARAQAELVREGAERASVDALFEVTPATAEALGLEGTEVVLSRQVFPEGRSQARVDGRPVPLGRLREIGESLVAMVAQGEGFRLRSPEEQVALLDRFGGLEAEVAEEQRLRAAEAALARALSQLEGDPRRRAREMERLRYEVEEIEAARLRPGEEEELRERLRLLDRQEEIRQALWQARAHLGGGERPGAYDLLAQADNAVRRAAGAEELFRPFLERLAGCLAELEDLAREARRLAEEVAGSPEEREEVLARLELLGDLRRRYGANAAEILRYVEEARAALERLAGAEAERARLEAELAAATAARKAHTERLAALRRQAAARLSQALVQELGALGLPHAQVLYQEAPRPSFLFSANPGARPRELGEVASGGELHRLLLALAVLGAEEGRTLVFDEVDTGVGGEAAQAVAARLARLGMGVQVVAVTHQAVLAAQAAHHVCLSKRVAEGRAVVAALPLRGEARIAELARMLSGRGDEAARRHARALLGEA